MHIHIIGVIYKNYFNENYFSYVLSLISIVITHFYKLLIKFSSEAGSDRSGGDSWNFWLTETYNIINRSGSDPNLLHLKTL